MKRINPLSILLVLIAIHFLLVSLFNYRIGLIQYYPKNIFIFDLIGRTFNISSGFLYIFDLGNLILFWLIAKKYFNYPFDLVPAAIYAISPWNIYLLIAGSFYIYLTFLILIIFYGYELIKINRSLIGESLLLAGVLVGCYSSFLLLLTFLILGICVLLFRLIEIKKIKNLFFLGLVLLLPLLLAIAIFQKAIVNIYSYEINLFDDPGLMNMINDYHGSTQRRGAGILGRIAESKYLIFTEAGLIKSYQQIIPSTVFTSQEKLLNFSFSPPIFLGFIAPFLFGIYQFLYFKKDKLLIIPLFLIIPSVLSRLEVDLSRLIIIEPFIIFLISYGICQLFKSKNKLSKTFITIFICLVVFQFCVTLIDISQNEQNRYVQTWGHDYQLGEQ